MKAKFLGERTFVGYSKGYRSVRTALKYAYLISDKNALTANTIAKYTNLSERHVNRLLLQMFDEGKVEFETFARGNRVGRLWRIK